MTKQESFKRRIRARMEKTGERYGAARRVLIEQAEHRDGRRWVSEPETRDDAVREATGRGYDEWCDLIEAWAGHDEGHTAVAAWLQEEHDVDGWWAQTVTVGWERITGRRLPYQRPDGTFAAGKSRTLTTDVVSLREMLLDDEDRDALFPGHEVELRSRATAKTLRLGIGGGVAQVTVDDLGEGRAKVTVQHEGLASPGDVEAWKEFWTGWLEALDES